jgi:hypothetical protein
MQSLTIYTVQFLYTSSLWFKKSIQKPQVCELPIKIMPRNLNEIVRSRIRLQNMYCIRFLHIKFILHVPKNLLYSHVIVLFRYVRLYCYLCANIGLVCYVSCYAIIQHVRHKFLILIPIFESEYLCGLWHEGSLLCCHTQVLTPPSSHKWTLKGAVHQCPGAFSPVFRIRSPHPLTRKGVLLLPLLGPRGETQEERVGGPNSDEGTDNLGRMFTIILLRSSYYR